MKLIDDKDLEASGLIDGQRLANILNKQMRQPVEAVEPQQSIDRTWFNGSRSNAWKDRGGKQT